MIARFATSPPANDPDIAAQRMANAQGRIKPGLLRQPGFRGAMWLRRPDGTVHSITLFDSEEDMRTAAEAINAQPMLAGHNPADMPGPDSGQTVEILQVLDVAFPETHNG